MAKKAEAKNLRIVTSGVQPGKASSRVQTRFIALYGPPKARKTSSCGKIKGAKWVISDSNCIPTLDARDTLPSPDDTYEVKSLMEAREVLGDFIRAAQDGKFWVPAVVVDSVTALNDFHQEDVATATGQKFLGQNKNNNGWQQFNAEFGGLIQDLAALSKYVNVIAICHAKEKFDAQKGDFNGLNLGPALATMFGRAVNWLLYQTCSSTVAQEDETENEFDSITKTRTGNLKVTTIIHTKPVGLWPAEVNARNLEAEEPADMEAILRKEGLI